MKNHPKHIKNTLFSVIRDMRKQPEDFCRCPEKDFTRNRKLPFEKLLTLLVKMGGHSLRDEMLDCIDFEEMPATVCRCEKQTVLVNVSVGALWGHTYKKEESLKPIGVPGFFMELLARFEPATRSNGASPIGALRPHPYQLSWKPFCLALLVANYWIKPLCIKDFWDLPIVPCCSLRWVFCVGFYKRFRRHRRSFLKALCRLSSLIRLFYLSAFSNASSWDKFFLPKDTVSLFITIHGTLITLYWFFIFSKWRMS